MYPIGLYSHNAKTYKSPLLERKVLPNMSRTTLMLVTIAIVAIASVTLAVSAPFASALGPLEKLSVENSRLVNLVGDPLGTNINVNQQVQITSDLRNNQDFNQKFIYIVQIKDSSDTIASLGWFSGNLNPNQVFSPALSWRPESGGEYTVEFFVWDGFQNQSPLSELMTLSIIAS